MSQSPFFSIRAVSLSHSPRISPPCRRILLPRYFPRPPVHVSALPQRWPDVRPPAAHVQATEYCIPRVYRFPESFWHRSSSPSSKASSRGPMQLLSTADPLPHSYSVWPLLSHRKYAAYHQNMHPPLSGYLSCSYVTPPSCLII